MTVAAAQSASAALAQSLLSPPKAATQTAKLPGLDNPRLKAAETQKTWAREKIQQLAKLLDILKKLYAQDPKRMAKALAQVFKDLSAAVKAYKAAAGDELGLSSDLTRAAAAPPPPPPDSATAAAAPKAPDTPDEAAKTTPEAASVYASADAQFRQQIAEDGLSFLGGVREFARKVSDVLESARLQAKARKKDKATDDAFDDVDKASRQFAKDMQDMERDLREAVPMAGLRLSVAA